MVLATAAIGGHLAEALGQPAVLGELVAGMLLGNLGLAGWSWPGELAQSPLVDGLARLGVILLLFEVGLESTVLEMRRVGARAALRARSEAGVPGVGAATSPRVSRRRSPAGARTSTSSSAPR